MNTELVPVILDTIAKISQLKIVGDVVTLTMVLMLVLAVLFGLPLAITKVGKSIYKA